jgi:hypothetical protein
MTVRKGKGARPSQVHTPKTRYRRCDKIDGVSVGDWYEQQVKSLKKERKK